MRRRPHPPSRFFSANDLEGQLSHAITLGPIPNQKYIALWDTFAAKWKAQQ